MAVYLDDEVPIACTGFVSVAVKVFNISNSHLDSRGSLLGRGFALFTIMGVVGQAVRVLGLDEVLVMDR